MNPSLRKRVEMHEKYGAYSGKYIAASTYQQLVRFTEKQNIS
jgi:hypothetical protein